MSATAKRGELHLIAVIMGASSRDARNTSAKKLLDIGFASKALFRSESTQLDPIPVHGSLGGSVTPLTQQFIRVIEKRAGRQDNYRVRAAGISRCTGRDRAGHRSSDILGRRKYHRRERYYCLGKHHGSVVF